MISRSFASCGRAALVLMILTSASCDDSTTAPPTPVLTTIAVTLPASSIVVGQTATAVAAGLDQNGAAIEVGAVAWSASPVGIVTVDETGGVLGVAPGTAQIIATGGGKTGQQTLAVLAPAGIKVNEVESNGGTPGDWAELYNPTATSVDVSAWVIRDNDDTHTYTIPAGTSIPAGGYLLAEEAGLGFGLGAADAVRLFSPFGVLVDSYSWTAHAAITYGRCPDGTGAFAATTASTKGAANVCAPIASILSAWPGSDDVQTVDGTSVFQTNLSGLTYEGAGGGSPAVLWAVRNGPGTLYRLIFSGGIWTPDPANSWGVGKALRYTDGLGNPDSEGVTFAASGSAGGMYVATERNNDASTISRSSVLRFDPNGAGASLTATNDWNLTSDLPVVGANLGIEAITWIPDSFLVTQGFYDETAQHVYAPIEYPDHGTGLFFVGVEGNGTIYVYALNHATNAARRVATIVSGFSGVMGLEFDRELNYLWATCDDTCGNKFNTLEINVTAGSPTLGRFLVSRRFDRPSTLPSTMNNEGFAIAPQSECAGGLKPVYWADDGETGGHSIRRASLPCARFP